MKCTRCNTENKRSLSYCEKCGAPLEFSIESNGSREITIFMVIVILLIMSLGYVYFFHGILFPTDKTTEIESSVYKNKYEKGKQEKQKGLEMKLRAKIKKQPAVKAEEKKITTKTAKELKDGKDVAAGWVTITDPWGRQVKKFRAGLAGDGWLALPARACIGGSRWYFFPDVGQETEISGGLWINGDKVGLWHLTKNDGNFDGPELASWNDKEPVSWFSLESADKYHSVNLSAGLYEGYFISSSLPDYINEIGIFVQSGKIVGWSFGQLLAKGYMWPGKAGTDLEYTTWVRYFYDTTFANGREEKFAMALAMQKDDAGLNQLASFIEGFRLQPKLETDDTPHYLLPEEIIKHMRILVTDAIRHGEGSEVIDMLSSQVLKDIGDIGLLMDVIPAIAVAHGIEAAIGEIEESGRYMVQQLGSDIPVLNELHVQLYQEWLQSLVSAREVDEGLQTYNLANAYYPDDPYIHLLGVELALLNGDWEKAERLLYMRNYPPDFQDRYQLLDQRISDMKGQEGKIVIRFPKGSDRISVTAAINETLYQDFVVDTGASIVSIPSSTAYELGLEIVQGHRTLSTAGGVVTAGEVIIDEIEIDGWVEYDIRALVLDIPDRPGLGLLGLSYLGRFRMDLKTDEGTLLLTPQ